MRWVGFGAAPRVAGSLRVPRGDVEEAHRLLKAALDLWRELGDTNELASTLMHLGWVHMAYGAHGHEGHDATARECFEEALRLWQIDRSVQEVEAVNALCMLDIEQGRIDSAEARARAARELALKTRNAAVEQMATHYLGDCALIRADYPTAAKR